MEGILEEYRRATSGLRSAIERMDDKGVAAELAARDVSIAAYAAEIRRWPTLPAEERTPSTIESLLRHHTCTMQADDELVRYIESLKSEVGDALVRIGKASRADRSYHPGPHGRSGILEGEG